MRITLRVVLAALLSAAAAGASVMAADYPLNAVADATLKSGATTITSVVTMKVDRLMDESQRKRVVDTLQYSGYGNAFNILRGLPKLGTIAVASRSVDIRFAAETKTDAGRRLVLVADKPLFLVNAQADKARAGYELTVVELTFDASGKATGTMAGGARVKPAGDGNVAMTDFADAPTVLTVRAAAR